MAAGHVSENALFLLFIWSYFREIAFLVVAIQMKCLLTFGEYIDTLLF